MIEKRRSEEAALGQSPDDKRAAVALLKRSLGRVDSVLERRKGFQSTDFFLLRGESVLDLWRLVKDRMLQTAKGENAAPTGASTTELLQQTIAHIDGVLDQSEDRQVGHYRILRGDCMKMLWELTQEPQFRAQAQASYTKVLRGYPTLEDVSKGTLLVRVFNLLSDDNLRQVVTPAPEILKQAWGGLDVWQRARARRLFPELDL